MVGHVGGRVNRPCPRHAVQLAPIAWPVHYRREAPTLGVWLQVAAAGQPSRRRTLHDLHPRLGRARAAAAAAGSLAGDPLVSQRRRHSLGAVQATLGRPPCSQAAGRCSEGHDPESRHVLSSRFPAPAACQLSTPSLTWQPPAQLLHADSLRRQAPQHASGDAIVAAKWLPAHRRTARGGGRGGTLRLALLLSQLRRLLLLPLLLPQPLLQPTGAIRRRLESSRLQQLPSASPSC